MKSSKWHREGKEVPGAEGATEPQPHRLHKTHKHQSGGCWEPRKQSRKHREERGSKRPVGKETEAWCSTEGGHRSQAAPSEQHQKLLELCYSPKAAASSEPISDVLSLRIPAPAGMIEVVCNDRLGKKIRVKCHLDDTFRDLKKLIAAHIGTRWNKILLKKWYIIFKDVALGDYEVHDGMNLELYYQ